MTIATYRTEYKALEAKREELGIAEFIKRVNALNEAYVVGKGSWLLPVVF